MGEVIDMFSRKKTSDANDETVEKPTEEEMQNYFKKIQEANKKKQAELALKRTQNNVNVMKSYRIK